MFSFSKKYNKTTFDVDTKDFEFIKLSEVAKASSPDEVHPVHGLWVSTSPLGESPVVIDATAKKLVNMPSHLAPTFKEILQDSEAVDAIKGGKVGYVIYTYQSHGKECFGVRFVDM